MSDLPGTSTDRARFETFVLFTIFKNEGGDKIYSDEKTGEYSKWGISLKFLQGLQPAATKEDIAALTLEDAEALYYEHFWKHPGIWRLDSDALAFRVFDLGVNNGPGVAVRLLQRAINTQTAGRVPVDGLLGLATAGAANGLREQVLLKEVIAQAMSRYSLIAAKDQNLAKSLKGWLERVERV